MYNDARAWKMIVAAQHHALDGDLPLLRLKGANNNEVKQWLPDYHDNKTKQFYVLNADRQFQFAMCTQCTMMPALGRPLLQRSTTPWTDIARISGVS